MKIHRIFKHLSAAICAALLITNAFADRTIQWSDNNRSLKIVTKGEVSFADNDAEVREISPDGQFVVEEKVGGHSRRLGVSKASDGSWRYIFSLDGKRGEWDASAKDWLAGILPEIIREAAIDAPARVRRIRKSSGPEGLLAEIARIRSDGAKRIYFIELFGSGELNSDQLKSAIQQIARDLRSDGDKTAVLIRVRPNYLGQSDLSVAYFGAVNTIRSDGDRRRVLESALENAKIENSPVVLILRSTGEISSDGDKTAVLVKVAHRLPDDGKIDPEVGAAFFKAAGTLHSDGDRRRVLTEIFKRQNLNTALWTDALNCTARLSSDGDKSATLIAALRTMPDDEKVQLTFIETARSIRSSGDHRRVLTEYFKRQNSPQNATVAALRSIDRISSDGDKSALLAENAKSLPNAEAVLNACLDAADSIHSQGDRERVLLALLDRENLPESILNRIKKAAQERGTSRSNSVTHRVAELELQKR